METKLIEVALALVVMYLVLALLATQLSELWAGAFSSRQRNLEMMVDEAFDGNRALAKAFFRYGPIMALSKNNSMGGLLKGRRRPSSIPPNLFATAFLATLNEGTPPRAMFQTPSGFVAAVKVQDATHQVLESQLAGTEADWDVFEARLARWYCDIGDRGEGWYKRRNALWMICASFLIALAINADTAFVARNLYENDAIRVGLANIGQTIASQEGRDKKAPDSYASMQTPSTDFEKASKAVLELGNARHSISAAIAMDPKVAAFGYNVQQLATPCVVDADAKKRTLYATNSDAWKVVLPLIQNALDEARLEVSLKELKVDDQSKQKFEFLQRDEKAAGLRGVLGCVARVSAWVRAAQGDADKGRTSLKEAAEALERAQQAVYDIVANAAVQSSLRKQFAADPNGFMACVTESGGSRRDFEQCLRVNGAPRIPLGWPAQADQFCEIVPLDAKASIPASRTDTGSLLCRDFPGNAALGVPPYKATFVMSKFWAAIGGILLTAVLVSLGAPFWFGLLGKVATIRAAGTVRGMGKPEASKGEASSQAPEGGTPASTTAGASQVFSDARNEFERGLRPQDITRLQKSLDVPATGRLDQVTRNQLGARLRALGQDGDEELGPVSYEAIVGRSAPSVAVMSEAPAGNWSRGHEAPVGVGELVVALNRVFPAPAWNALPLTTTSFDDEVRARTTLFRVRMEDGVLYQDRSAVKLASKANGALTQLDDSTRAAILKRGQAFVRNNPPWLDDALGELGITEVGSPAQSDPRVEEYLHALGVAPITGDDTPWCGAFVAWVMARAGRLTAANYGHGPETLLRAENWKRFGQPVAAGDERSGDICVIPSGSSHHVAFWIDRGQSRVWLLGGNQGGLGAVTLVAFREIPGIDIRRPI